MGTPHKHAALIKAWADGAEIQLKCSSGWIDTDPRWLSYVEYRIKPKTIKYRIALWKPMHVATPDKIIPIMVTWEENLQQPRELWKGFVRWLSDWIEVEI